MEVADPVARFFYSLMVSKKPSEKDGDRALFAWGIKYLIGRSFFWLNAKYYNFWRRSTKHYPFSLLYKDRLFHYKNQSVNKFMIKLEELFKQERLNTNILTGEYGIQICEFYGSIKNKRNISKEEIILIEKILQNKFDSIYVREHNNGFRILVPTEMLISMNVLDE